MAQYPSSDLLWYPAVLAGGIVDSTPVPRPEDLARVDEFTIFRGRLALRAPLTETVRLVDDTAFAAVTQVLAICYHVGKCYVVAHSSSQTDTYLYRLETTGYAETTDARYPDASPIATIWAGATVPRVNMVSFEGGSATAGKQRLYIADYTGTYHTRYWNSTDSSIADVEEDFDDDGAKEDLYFKLIFAYNAHLFGTDFRQVSTIQKGLLRISQPGLIPADEPGVTNNVSREWWNSDFRQVGSRGDSLTAVADAAGAKILYKRRQAWALYGFDIASFAIRPIAGAPGAVGPQATANLPDGRCVAWGDRGPYLCDGQRAVDIGGPIRKRINAIAISQDTCLGYSIDDGLLYCVVPGTAGSPNLHLAWDLAAERWVNEGTWKGISDSSLFAEAFTTGDGALNGYNSWVDGADSFDIASNVCVGNEPDFAASFTSATRSVAGITTADDVSISCDFTLPTTTDNAQKQAIALWDNGANNSGIRLEIDVTSPTQVTLALRRYNMSLNEVQTETLTGLSWAAGVTKRVTLRIRANVVTASVGSLGSVSFVLNPVYTTTPTNTIALRFYAGASALWNYKFDNLSVVEYVSVSPLAVNDIEPIPDDTLTGPAGPPESVAVAVTSDTELALSWTNGDTAIDTVTDIHRSTSSSFTPSAANLIDTVLSGVAEYDDDGLTPKTTYYYQLIHRLNGQSSDPSTETSGKTALATPTALTASSLANGIHLAFNHNANGSDYTIQRKPPSGSFVDLVTVAAAASGAKTYDDTTATCGLLYTYRVRAEEGGETDSPYSNEASWTACSTIPVLTTVRHSATIGDECPTGPNVSITWLGTGLKPADTVLIERNDNGAGYATLKTVPAQDLATLDTWGRRSGAVSHTLRYRLTPYDGGTVAGTPVETTQSAHDVNASTCPE